MPTRWKALASPLSASMRGMPRRALLLKVNKTDANDALGLAQIMHVGWYREMTVKSEPKKACGAVGQRKGQERKEESTSPDPGNRNCAAPRGGAVRTRTYEQATTY
jgi:hypothetical protein